MVYLQHHTALRFDLVSHINVGRCRITNWQCRFSDFVQLVPRRRQHLGYGVSPLR